MDRIARLRAVPRHLVVGLISGTSADAVDAAVVRLSDQGERVRAELLGFVSPPYPTELRDRVLRAGDLRTAELAALNVEIGRAFADAANAAIRAANLDRDDVDLIGSHGQTVHHRPPDATGRGWTLQLGCAATIAEETGLPVVSDFRARDMAVGGHGAPLVPLADHHLFVHPRERRVLLNVGGIANVSVVAGSLDSLVAFDTGPGNALMDALVRLATAGRESFDEGGRRAARGRIFAPLLRELMAHPFLRLRPPRSADRDTFGEPLARTIRTAHPDLADDDRIATALAFTIESVVAALEAPPVRDPPIDRVIVSGGGTENPILMARLRSRLGVPVDATADHGVPDAAKEAIAFALLARQTVLGRPGNVPRATGATRPVLLGTVTG